MREITRTNVFISLLFDFAEEIERFMGIVRGKKERKEK